MNATKKTTATPTDATRKHGPARRDGSYAVCDWCNWQADEGDAWWSDDITGLCYCSTACLLSDRACGPLRQDG